MKFYHWCEIFECIFQNNDLASSVQHIAGRKPHAISTIADCTGLNNERPYDFSHTKNPSQISDPEAVRPTRAAKILFLGGAESGKSTLVRQLRLINGQTFTDAELLRYKKLIRSSCLELFAVLVSEYVPVEQGTSEWKESCYDFLGRLTSNEALERDVMDSAVAVWKDPIIQEFLVDMESSKVHFRKEIKRQDSPSVKDINPNSFSTSENVQLGFYPDDPAYHFLPSLDRIMSKGYSPTNSDILSVRIPTTGSHYITNILSSGFLR